MSTTIGPQAAATSRGGCALSTIGSSFASGLFFFASCRSLHRHHESVLGLTPCCRAVLSIVAPSSTAAESRRQNSRVCRSDATRGESLGHVVGARRRYRDGYVAVDIMAAQPRSALDWRRVLARPSSNRQSRRILDPVSPDLPSEPPVERPSPSPSSKPRTGGPSDAPAARRMTSNPPAPFTRPPRAPPSRPRGPGPASRRSRRWRR